MACSMRNRGGRGLPWDTSSSPSRDTVQPGPGAYATSSSPSSSSSSPGRSLFTRTSPGRRVASHHGADARQGSTGGKFSKTGRFREKSNESPGPGSYHRSDHRDHRTVAAMTKPSPTGGGGSNGGGSRRGGGGRPATSSAFGVSAGRRDLWHAPLHHSKGHAISAHHSAYIEGPGPGAYGSVLGLAANGQSSTSAPPGSARAGGAVGTFSRSRVPRLDQSTSPVPGPGQYDTHQGSAGRGIAAGKAGVRRAKSLSNMSPGKHGRDLFQPVETPGPGSYRSDLAGGGGVSVGSQWGPAAVPIGGSGTSSSTAAAAAAGALPMSPVAGGGGGGGGAQSPRSAFGSNMSRGRFDPAGEPSSPGPGAYSPATIASGDKVDVRHRPVSAKMSPSTSAARLRTEPRRAHSRDLWTTNDTPGPGAHYPVHHHHGSGLLGAAAPAAAAAAGAGNGAAGAGAGGGRSTLQGGGGAGPGSPRGAGPTPTSPSFGSTKKRFHTKADQSPGPGYYDAAESHAAVLERGRYAYHQG